MYVCVRGVCMFFFFSSLHPFSQPMSPALFYIQEFSTTWQRQTTFFLSTSAMNVVKETCSEVRMDEKFGAKKMPEMFFNTQLRHFLLTILTQYSLLWTSVSHHKK